MMRHPVEGDHPEADDVAEILVPHAETFTAEIERLSRLTLQAL